MDHDDRTTSQARPGPTSRRERLRAATIEEIKATALRLMAEHGVDVRFADIAREMGVTAPALYRYFPDRDELLTALMVDGFHELAATVTEALETAPADDLAARIRAVARGYRGFASEDAQRFSLLFGLPAPGYASHSDSGAVHANVAVMRAFEKLVPADVAPGQLQPLVRAVGRALAEDIERAQGPRIPPDVYQSLLHLLAAIHGFAALETFGHLNWISERARDELFEAQISLHTHAMAAFALGR